ncbi:LamG domain-containing protein [Streptomyces sp. SID13031]|uniref:LamG-like jellyroll fold domain-containing protein n=1 Tax=Streptomyces sp. SID13031 TaxID=2706046 RepID=UPI0013C6BF4F|nr:LamG domain-containing protein [Streptomyces sp. SID13031]
MRGAVVIAALSFAIAGLTGLQAAAGSLDDPPVPPAPPQIAVSYNGVEILDCGTQPSCPKTAVTGEPVTVTITATSPNLVSTRVRFNSVIEDHDGANLTLSLTPPYAGWNTLDVQSVNELGQFSTSARFLFNVGPRPKPVGSWGFDDGSGTTAADAAVPAHPLTLVNGASLDGKGRIIGSVALDGTNDYAEAAEPVVDTSKSFTISAWARPTKASQTGVVAAVSGTNSSAFGLYYDASAKRWLFARTSADVNNPTRYQAASKEAPVNGAWTHLIGTYDASTGALQLYVNGRSQQTATSPTTPAWQASGPLTVGRAKYAGVFTGQFAGSLDQINLWQRVIVPEEIPALVDPRLGSSGNDRLAAGLAAYWPFDNAVKGAGNVWHTPETVRGADLTVAGFGATSNQSGAFVDDPERGHVLEMTGKSRESVTLNSPVVDGSLSFTVAVRVKLADSSKPVVIARQGTSGKDTWRLEYQPLDEFRGQFIFARGDAASTGETLATAKVDRETLAEWHLLAGAYTLPTDTDPTGDLFLTVDYRGSDGSSQSYPATPPRAGATVVGAARTAGKSFAGRLDDLRLYAGNAQGPRLCEDYPDLDRCGS